MRKVLRGYARDENRNLTLIGTIPIPDREDKCPPVARRERRRSVRQGATIFKEKRFASHPSFRTRHTLFDSIGRFRWRITFPP